MVLWKDQYSAYLVLPERIKGKQYSII